MEVHLLPDDQAAGQGTNLRGGNRDEPVSAQHVDSTTEYAMYAAGNTLLGRCGPKSGTHQLCMQQNSAARYHSRPPTCVPLLA